MLQSRSMDEVKLSRAGSNFRPRARRRSPDLAEAADRRSPGLPSCNTIVTPFWETFGRLAVRGRETRAQQRSVWKCTEGSRDSSRYLQNQSLANPIWITLFRDRKILVRQPEVGVDRIRKEIISQSGINPLPVIVFLDGQRRKTRRNHF